MVIFSIVMLNYQRVYPLAIPPIYNVPTETSIESRGFPALPSQGKWRASEVAQATWDFTRGSSRSHPLMWELWLAIKNTWSTYSAKNYPTLHTHIYKSQEEKRMLHSGYWILWVTLHRPRPMAPAAPDWRFAAFPAASLIRWSALVLLGYLQICELPPFPTGFPTGETSWRQHLYEKTHEKILKHQNILGGNISYMKTSGNTICFTWHTEGEM